MDPDHNSAAPEVCPACGTPYPLAGKGGGCPVCLMWGALGCGATNDGALADEQRGLPEEGRFDHYAVVQRADGAFEELGRGAMGVTYRAVDTVLGHAVALKVLDPRVATHPQARERFLREARAAARLRHPNVASVLYYGVRHVDGQCFYAMELVEGESVETRLRRTGPLPVPVALEVVTQVARALGAAEAQGLVHRDLKPANLMLANGPELCVKVIDFGLAKAAVDAASEADLTQGGFVGTPAFASPEQCAAANVDVRSDLYSLGITFWTMLTGQTPFRGSPTKVRQQHQSAPLPIEQLERVPQPAVALLEALLEKDPARRFQTPTQLLNALPKVTAAVKAARTLTLQHLRKASLTASGAIASKRGAAHGPKKISLARLPVTGKEVFGREEDLAFLNAAWANRQVNLVTIVAWAGVGKSTLVNRWLRRLAAEGYRSAERVFSWSFYRQGTSGDVSSADEFLDTALAWFGDADPRLGTAWEKGERLARLIAQRRTLVVLDGLEPLQDPPGRQEGRLRDPSLQALLRELAAFNRGLCVITTRLPVADLAEYEGSSALRLDLEDLSSGAGADVLRALGVRGSEAELRRASEEFRGHCLALTLLGSYLSDAYQGDIHYRAEVLDHLAHDVRQGAHARKVMASYQRWFGEGPELSVLRLLGFFDRPAEQSVLGALLKPPPVSGLTEPLTDLSPSQWRTLLAKLRRAKLLAGEDPHQPGQLDAHPLVREYFGEQLRTQRTEAWREGNRRLYEHYRALAPERPDSFREMEPLFLAVACGCQAGLLRDALHQVYIPRIQRGTAYFAANVLGARGALLSALVHFFEDGHWGSPVQRAVEGQSLTTEDQLFVLTQAGLYLSATRGFSTPEAYRCYERAEPLCGALDRPVDLYSALMGQWRYTYITGNPKGALPVAQRVYALAEQQHNATIMLGACQALVSTLYYLGEFEAARQFARRGVELWRSGSLPSHADDLDAPFVVCLCYEALCGWHFGKIAACQVAMAEAVSLAKALKDANTVAVAVYFATYLARYLGNPAEVKRLATELVELATRQHFALWEACGVIFRSWACSASGDSAQGLAGIEDGVRAYRGTGSMLSLPYWLALKAEALHLAHRTSEGLEAIGEAATFAQRTGVSECLAELYRLRGMFLAAMGGDEAQIEAAFHQAIHTAQQQKSISLLKRAEASYADYRRSTGIDSGGTHTQQGR